jgi:hypothetical protein
MSGAEFRIRYADGLAERLVIDSERVRIGSGAHCEVRLPPEQAAVEHVLVTLRGGGVQLQALALHPPPTINSSPFTEAPLLPDSILGIGKVEVQIAAIEITENEGAVKESAGKRASPLSYALILIAMPIVMFILLHNRASGKGNVVPTDSPPLWGSATPACPHSDKNQAAAFAQDQRGVAESKRGRSPFYLQDGVSAVPTFELAAACFRAAGDEASAAQMTAAASALRAELEEAYRVHRARLEHVMKVGDERTALQEVKILLVMLEGQTGDYVVTLSNMSRRLALKVRGQKSK